MFIKESKNLGKYKFEIKIILLFHQNNYVGISSVMSCKKFWHSSNHFKHPT